MIHFHSYNLINGAHSNHQNHSSKFPITAFSTIVTASAFLCPHTVQMDPIQLDALLINLYAIIVVVSHFILQCLCCPAHSSLLIRRDCKFSCLDEAGSLWEPASQLIFICKLLHYITPITIQISLQLHLTYFPMQTEEKTQQLQNLGIVYQKLLALN